MMDDEVWPAFEVLLRRGFLLAPNPKKLAYMRAYTGNMERCMKVSGLHRDMWSQDIQ